MTSFRPLFCSKSHCDGVIHVEEIFCSFIVKLSCFVLQWNRDRQNITRQFAIAPTKKSQVFLYLNKKQYILATVSKEKAILHC